jgi:hypothetical protein
MLELRRRRVIARLRPHAGRYMIPIEADPARDLPGPAI